MIDRKSSYDDYVDEDKIFSQSYHNIISTFSKMKNQIKPPGLPEAVMASSKDKNEIYTEMTWNNFKRNEISAKWRLTNPKQTCWPKKI